jgi:2-dehydro-3-deoxyphosphogluconate aldolase / (4S)-4-hydroxy-2-oxoglutarate aldolase
MTALVDARTVIEEERLLAIVRVDGADAAALALRRLAEAGVRALEISLAGDGAIDALAAIAQELGGDIAIGAGTVLSVDDAERAVEAGASYLVSPAFDADVLAWAQERDVLHLPGTFSPTEVFDAHRAGARLIKLFPAARLGPRYIADLLGPLPDLRLVPTGGIDTSNARDFLDAGAVAVAVGSALTGLVERPDELRVAAARLTDLTRSRREQGGRDGA